MCVCVYRRLTDISSICLTFISFHFIEGHVTAWLQWMFHSLSCWMWTGSWARPCVLTWCRERAGHRKNICIDICIHAFDSVHFYSKWLSEFRIFSSVFSLLYMVSFFSWRINHLRRPTPYTLHTSDVSSCLRCDWDTRLQADIKSFISVTTDEGCKTSQYSSNQSHENTHATQIKST